MKELSFNKNSLIPSTSMFSSKENSLHVPFVFSSKRWRVRPTHVSEMCPCYLSSIRRPSPFHQCTSDSTLPKDGIGNWCCCPGRWLWASKRMWMRIPFLAGVLDVLQHHWVQGETCPWAEILETYARMIRAVWDITFSWERWLFHTSFNCKFGM